ncbi:SAM-dependent methyltransferase TehB [Moraxella sp. ZY210820]|uniref:SAM-dependent methyltransferase TehB n=1 Tax=unclassified Moraxella TaxID=2685852 RepID=UPI00272F0375|nr:SAM-dependent methyltransferase TehB [Moraxella sp. ZY210820]WLF83950.1 SAM-dependent methyltransferase TehB [Moraxella sp. ZY210820]
MSNLICYKQFPIWSANLIPQGFKQPHNTQQGTWAKLEILKGTLTFAFVTSEGEMISLHDFDKNTQPPMIEPQVWHQIVEVSDDVECQLSFYCEEIDYFAKKYQITAVHSEVKEALPQLNVGRALDLGCGMGRNSLFLSQYGFQVDAWDNNENSLAKLNEILQHEQIQQIKTEIRDLNLNVHIEQAYDFILSTVVFMFLQPQCIAPLIQSMQNATKIGGFNLIVCAMDSEDYPVNMPFSFTFKTNELQRYYRQWNIVKYNEDVGQLHKVDANGQRIQLRFATLLAQRIA